MSKWVPVDDNLPPFDDRVYEVLCMGQSVYRAQRVDPKLGLDFDWHNQRNLLHGITHWREVIG